MDVINTIALAQCADANHSVHYWRDADLQSMSLAQFDGRARDLALRLMDLGIRRGDRVGVMSGNCIEWALLDVALLKLGAITAGLDVGRFSAAYALERFGLRWLFVEGGCEQPGPITSLAKVWDWASSQGTMRVLEAHDGYGSGDACAIKFTSGSTGPPKGMEVLVGGINDSLADVQEMFHHGADDNILVFLRLAQLQQRYWLYSALAFGHDVTITSLDRVFRAAQATRPTVIMGVPGFFEDVKRQLEIGGTLAPADLGERFDAIQSLFGGRIRYLWTGSAPAGRATLDFYFDCGIPLYQGYGLNETCIVAKNCPGANRIGSVGRILPNKRIRFDSQGVLVVGSKNPFVKRYEWCSPQDNERMFLPTGEIVTQDLAYVDDDGFLYIVGRVDDVVVLATGRNVLVTPLEARLKGCTAIHECVLFGQGRPFLVAVISPVHGEEDRAGIEAHVQALNVGLFPEQQVRGVVLATERFSMENGLLTPQYKPLRREIFARYACQIEMVYDAPPQLLQWRGTYGQ